MDMSSAAPWLSEMGMDDGPKLLQQCDLLDYFLNPPDREDLVPGFVPQENGSLIPEATSTSPPAEMNPSSYLLHYGDSNLDAAQQLCIDSFVAETLAVDPPPNEAQQYAADATAAAVAGRCPGGFGRAQAQSTNPAAAAGAKGSPDEGEQAAAAMAKAGEGMKRSRSSSRLPSQVQDHIMAERKRREQLSQGFSALSAIVPGIKKTDKTSVLGEAIKYLKQLQERAKLLEEQEPKPDVESVVVLKKSQLLNGTEDDREVVSSGECPASGGGDEVPGGRPPPLEIEAWIRGKNVHLRMHCPQCKGILLKTVEEIEKHNLTVISSNAVPFGNLAFNITIIAEMETDFNSTVKEMERGLRSALRAML